jgi:hypothetical protein
MDIPSFECGVTLDRCAPLWFIDQILAGREPPAEALVSPDYGLNYQMLLDCLMSNS